jgi:nucleoside-diphosphate-sugar epimerase
VSRDIRVLVTGARGFIGRHVVRSLRALWPEAVVLEQYRGATGLLGADLLDAPAVRRLVAQSRCTHIVNACGCHGRRPLRDFFLLHCVVTGHLLSAVERAGTPVRWFNIGSSAQYGEQDPVRHPVLDENYVDDPRSAYAVSKSAQEQLIASSAERGWVEPVFLRFFNPIGPSQQKPFLVPTIVDALRRGNDGRARLRLNTDHVRDFLDVRDAGAAVVAAMRSNRSSGERLNVCSGRGTRVGELARLVAQAAGVEPLFEYDADPELEESITFQRGSFEKINRLCGWQPQVSLVQTARDIWAAAVVSREAWA